MRHHISRHACAQLQPGASRLTMPPARASSGASATQDIPSSLSNVQPDFPRMIPTNQAPGHNQVIQAPSVQTHITPSPVPVPAASGAAHSINGAALLLDDSAPQANTNDLSGMDITQFNQRVLKDYLAMMQSQLVAMNQVVAATVAQNQALTAQNRTLFEELRALKQHVQIFASGGPANSATDVAASVTASAPTTLVAPPATLHETPELMAEPTPVLSAPTADDHGTAMETESLQRLPRQPPLKPVVKPQAGASQLQHRPDMAAVPAPLSHSGGVGPVASDDDTGLQILSLVALELAGFAEVGSLEAAGVIPATQGPTDSVATAAANLIPSVSGSGRTAVPGRSLTPRLSTPSYSDSTKPSTTELAPPVDKPSGAELTAQAANNMVQSQPQQATRPPGRGGHYVGPPRIGPYTRTAQNAGAGNSSWPDAAPAEGTQPNWNGPSVTASSETQTAGTGSSLGFGKVSAKAATSYRAGNAGRVGRRVGAGSAAAKPATTAIPGDGGSNVDFTAHAHAVGTAAVAAAEPAGPTGAVSVSSQIEKRIRLSSTANELLAIVEGDRLSPQQSVLVAQQLPRIARLAQERQQELRLQDATMGNSAESEIQILRTLFLRLIHRFSSPSALSSLRAAFLPNYVVLAFISGELRQAPSRAFAGALRQLVTQHVTEVAPEVAAAAVAAVALLDGTVAPGVLERACKVVTEGQKQLVGWKALVAAGQLAPLGHMAVDVARQVLSAAQATCAALAADDAPADPATGTFGDLDGEALVAAAQAVLACSAAGLAVPSVLLKPLVAASQRERVLAAVGPSGQLLVAQAFVAAGHQPEDVWLRVWEKEVVASMTRSSPIQVAALVGVLHALTRVSTASASGPSRHNFAVAASERLLASGAGAGVTGSAAACALALHIGELAAGGSDGSTIAAAPVSITMQLGEALLRVASASLTSLDTPDLAALLSGLSLLNVRAPADVWSALLSRATDAPVAAAAATSAARRAMELGLPGGINPASLEHFLSVGGKHVGELPAASLVGLLGLAAAVNGKIRPGLAAAVLTRLYDQAATMGPRDAALTFAAVDRLTLLLTQPFAARPFVAAGDKKNDGYDAATALTPAIVLRRIAEAALAPEQVLAALGLEHTAEMLELVARLQQAAAASTAPSAAPMTTEIGASASISAVTDQDSLSAEDGRSGRDSSEGHRLVPNSLLIALLTRVQPLLAEASPQALGALVSSAAALNLSVPPDWLAAVVASTRSLMPLLGPMTWSRIAAALTRCEQLAGLAPGSAGDAEGGSWMDEFIDDIQRKLPAAPPAALAQTLQVLVAHGKQPSVSWTTDFLGAAMPWLEVPLPLTQAQAAGAAAVAASFAASRARPTGRNVSGPTASSAPRLGVALAPTLPGQQPDSGITPVQGPIASTFTPPQLAELLGGLAALKLKQYITPRWLAAAVRQVEGRAVHFTYRDLAEALYGVSCLGGVVRDVVCNQLFIVSLAKLSTAPPRLLARTLAVASAAEGRKISPKWWEEAEKALVARLGDIGGFQVTKIADGGAWQTSDLILVVESVLALHRDKDEMKISPGLARALATVVDYGGDGTMAAALPLEVAVSYVEACGKIRQLGRPPLNLLERYLSYSIHRFATLTDDSLSASLTELAKAHQQVPLSDIGKGKAREKRVQKRARERVAKQASGGGVTSPLVQHLQSAVGVGKLLVDTLDLGRLAAASTWLETLAAAGAVAAPLLPPSCAADVLLLIAKLEGSSSATTAATERAAEWFAQVEALAARVCASADTVPAANAHASRARRSVFGPDAVVETVWALQTLGFRPTEGLLYDLACILPRRLAATPPAEVVILLTALADAGAVGAKFVTEANVTAFSASVSGKAAAADSLGAPTTPVKLATELGRYLDMHMSALSDSQLVEALAAAANLGIKLPSTVTSVASARLAEAVGLGTLRGGSLFDAVQSLCRQDATLPADQLEPLCEAVAKGALDGTLGGTFQIAQLAASLYDMGARPGPEWLSMMSEAVLDDLGFSVSSHGSIRRPPLTARGLIISLHELSTRFDANYVTLAMQACRAAMEDLEGQLQAAEGSLVSQPLQQRPEWGWRVPVEESNTGAGNRADVAATSLHLDPKQQPAAGSQQPQEEADEDEEVDQVYEEEVLTLDPELLLPLGLNDVVLLLKGLSEARQEPPPAMWELLERALRPALQLQQQPLASGSDNELILLQIRDDDLSGLLTQMQRLNVFASITFLQDLEGYLGRRMPVQGHIMLAAFASHCSTRSYIPDPKFMRLFRRRIEDVLADVDTHSALLLLQFLLLEAFENGRKNSGQSKVDADRAQEKHENLLQSLLERTEGKDLLSFAAVAEDETRSASVLMIALIHSFGLRLPHANSPERQTAWLMALQALTIHCMDHVGWCNVAELLRMIHGSGRVPQPEWLAALYKGLEAAADTASPHDVAGAALAIASANFKPALAPTLPAKLAGVLERRMGEFASTDSRVIAHLLHAVGIMGHTLRTEVLQASEMLLAAPLARAPEVLQETHEALAKLSECVPEASLLATLEAAQELLRQENLFRVCMALKVHGYRPVPSLVDALMGAAWVLHRATHMLLQETEKHGARNRSSSPLEWSDVICFGGVLSTLAEWGVEPTELWLDSAAMALPVVATLVKPVYPRQELMDAELGVICSAVAALESWGHQLSEREVVALQRAVEERVEICNHYDCEVNEELVRLLCTGLEERLSKARKHHAGAAVSEAEAWPPARRSGWKAVEPSRQAADSAIRAHARPAREAAAPVSRTSIGHSNINLVEATEAYTDGQVVRAGFQQGPMAPAEYQDLRPDFIRDEGQRVFSPTPVEVEERSHQQVGGGFVPLAEAAAAIASAVQRTELEPQTPVATAFGGISAKPTIVITDEAEAAAVFMSPPRPLPVTPAVAAARESPSSQLGERPAAEPAPPLNMADTTTVASASGPDMVKNPKAEGRESVESGVDAQSTRVAFRRLAPAEHAGAEKRSHGALAPPSPPSGAGVDERTGRAILQLLQLMPKSSRPQRMAAKLTRVDDEDDNYITNGDSEGDQTSYPASLPCKEGLLAAATASRVAAATANNSSVQGSGATGGRVSGRRKVRASSQAQGGLARHAGTTVTAACTMPAAISGLEKGSALLDPQNPSTWNLLDREIDVANGRGAADQAAESGSTTVLVVEPQVLEP